MSVQDSDYGNDYESIGDLESSASDYPDFVPYAYDDEENDSFLTPSRENAKSRKQKKIDSGLKVFTHVISKKRTVRVSAYDTSSMPNKLIRDAVSGQYTQYRVGSIDEDLFFSVCVATGEHGQEPVFLYFDSPEQYERVFMTVVQDESKARWRLKHDTRKLALNYEMSVGDVVVK